MLPRCSLLVLELIACFAPSEDGVPFLDPAILTYSLRLIHFQMVCLILKLLHEQICYQGLFEYFQQS